jgi:hypothetical protein
MFCSICLSDIVELHITRCMHKFCSGCINRWLDTSKTCPECRTELSGERTPDYYCIDHEYESRYGYESDFGYETTSDDDMI